MKFLLALGGGALAMIAVLGALPGTERALPYYTDVTLTPRWFPGASRDSVHTVGDFRLIDQTGRVVTRESVAGHIYVASFFYTECRTLCPEIRDELARVRDEFSGDSAVMIVAHSVTPERDDVARLAHYARVHGIDQKQWLLLSGSRVELERLAKERYFVELSDTTGNTKGQLKHTETLVLVDGTGRIRGVYDGSMPFDVTQLINDIHTLERERRT